MTTWHWIDEAEVLAIHRQSLADHGGAGGVRDLGLLRSAIARPQQIASYREDANVWELAAALTAAIVRNHPFVDGNKRVGFVCGVLFLELNGQNFEAPQREAADAVIALAAGTITEPQYAEFLHLFTWVA